MRNVALDSLAARHESPNEGIRSAVSDLVSIVEQVQSSMRAIEAAIVREAASNNPQPDSSIVILDDLTPRYLEAIAALSACDVKLGLALEFLLDATRSRQGSAMSGRPDPV
jgi:hypothetical protein